MKTNIKRQCQKIWRIIQEKISIVALFVLLIIGRNIVWSIILPVLKSFLKQSMMIRNRFYFNGRYNKDICLLHYGRKSLLQTHAMLSFTYLRCMWMSFSQWCKRQMWPSFGTSPEHSFMRCIVYSLLNLSPTTKEGPKCPSRSSWKVKALEMCGRRLSVGCLMGLDNASSCLSQSSMQSPKK